MSSEKSPNMGQMDNIPIYNSAYMPEMQQTYPQAAVKPVMEEASTYRAVYPEVFYKLKPYIEMACDLTSTYGAAMPTQEQLEQMSDSIYEDFCAMHPDMADYMRKGENSKDDPPGDPPPFRGGFRDGFRDGFRPGFGFGGFRRRGLGRDLIATLLLAELLGRGRYYNY